MKAISLSSYIAFGCLSDRNHNRGLNYICHLFDRNSEVDPGLAFWRHWGLGFRHQVFSSFYTSALLVVSCRWCLSLLPQNDSPSCKHYIPVEEHFKQEGSRCKSKCFLLAYHSCIHFLSALPISTPHPTSPLSLSHIQPLWKTTSPHVSRYKTGSHACP